MVNGRDKADRFIDKGIWEHGFDDDRFAIQATGVIAENSSDGRQVRVRWQEVSPPREWYFYTFRPPSERYRPAIGKPPP
jgi:hypothetical protein